MEHLKPLLEVNHLSVSFEMYDGAVSRHNLEVISDLSISVNAGEVLAIAGSSGSGKSLLAHAILGVLPVNAAVRGEIRYQGKILDASGQKWLRGSGIALIPQSVTYLDPLMKVKKQVYGTNSTAANRARQREACRSLGLTPEMEKLYPFQLSGGMARRVLLSTAVMSGAELIIADEPTPGMHPDQALEALGILKELADAGKGVILITHDVDLALNFADRIAVFYAGTTVEEALAADFLSGPEELRHPYSKALWRALPQNGFQPIEGTQPYAGTLPDGCLFAPRCRIKSNNCEKKKPPMKKLRGGMVRCLHAT